MCLVFTRLHRPGPHFRVHLRDDLTRHLQHERDACTTYFAVGLTGNFGLGGATKVSDMGAC